MFCRYARQKIGTTTGTPSVPILIEITQPRQPCIKFGLLINNVCDGIAFSAKYLVIDKGMLHKVSGVNSIATIAGCGAGAVEQVLTLANKPKDPFYPMICLARDVSFVAVGVLGLYAFVTAAAVAPLDYARLLDIRSHMLNHRSLL